MVDENEVAFMWDLYFVSYCFVKLKEMGIRKLYNVCFGDDE